MRFFKLICAVVGCLAIAGCNLDQLGKDKPEEDIRFNDDGKPHYIITVNEHVKYPTAKQVEKKISTVTGTDIWVNTNYFVHSKYIEDIKLVPCPEKKGFFTLRLKLNSRGIKHWVNMAVTMSYSKVVFVIDGLAYRVFKPEMVNEKDGWVNVDVPFDKYTADALKHYAKSNYEYYNPDHFSLF